MTLAVLVIFIIIWRSARCQLLNNILLIIYFVYLYTIAAESASRRQSRSPYLYEHFLQSLRVVAALRSPITVSTERYRLIFRLWRSNQSLHVKTEDQPYRWRPKKRPGKSNSMVKTMWLLSPMLWTFKRAIIVFFLNLRKGFNGFHEV